MFSRLNLGRMLMALCVVLILGVGVGMTDLPVYAFEGFHDDTAEPCFDNDPFCSDGSGGSGGGGGSTTCKKCEVSSSSVTCKTDSSGSANHCSTVFDQNNTATCELTGSC